MKLELNNNIYELDGTIADSVISAAGTLVKNGIYAVKKDDVVIMKNDLFDNTGNLMAAVNEYKENGFTVFYNVEE